MSLPHGIPASISKERLLELPLARYEGEVCLVEGSADIARAREDILAEHTTGFDTETRPAFVSGQSYPPALVQQLKPGGRLVIPVGEPGRTQDLRVIHKDGQGVVFSRSVLPVVFVPLIQNPG